MASPTRWTWVWVNSGSWWWTGRPGVLWFMGLQRVGHDWATELNWTELVVSDIKLLFIVLIGCLFIFFVTLCGPFAHLWNGLLIFLLLNCKYSLFWIPVPYQVYDFHIFDPVSWIVFLTFLVTFFEAQAVLILISPFHLLCHFAFGVIFRFLKIYACVFLLRVL